MFCDSKAFFSYSVPDLAKAKSFYTDVLGLSVEETEEALSIKLAGGGSLFLYPKPNHEPATFTVLNFPVDSIDRAMEQLSSRGVRFEHYDLPDLKTDAKGIFRTNGMSIAWFKDPAGNILSIVEQS